MCQSFHSIPNGPPVSAWKVALTLTVVDYSLGPGYGLHKQDNWTSAYLTDISTCFLEHC